MENLTKDSDVPITNLAVSTALEFNDRKIVETNIDPNILQVTSIPDNNCTKACAFLFLGIVNQLTKNSSYDYKSLKESVIVSNTEIKICWLTCMKHIAFSQKMPCLISSSSFLRIS